MTSAELTASANIEQSRTYVRFIVLCAARTGSFMLTTSLNSSPNIVCSGEVLNPFVKHVAFGVDGNKIVDPDKSALRNRDFKQVLDTRVYCERPDEIRAVGFKAPHPHFWAQKELLEWLVDERDIRVLHLRRRNVLRRLVSERIAVDTGVWTEYQGHTLRSLAKFQNVAKAARHPLRAATALGWALQPKKQHSKARRHLLALSIEECRHFFAKDAQDTAYYQELFGEHDIHTLYYEDLTEHFTDTLNKAQAFLGLEPVHLTPMTRRQNPEPLRELIENYDELYQGFAGTAAAAYFD